MGSGEEEAEVLVLMRGRGDRCMGSGEEEAEVAHRRTTAKGSSSVFGAQVHRLALGWKRYRSRFGTQSFPQSITTLIHGGLKES